MCSPTIFGVVAGLASTALNYAAQSSMQKAQSQANNEWAARQRMNQVRENQRQDELRQRAEVSRQAAVDEMAPAEQQKAQETEQARLTKEIEPSITEGSAVDKNLLSGQTELGGNAFVADVGSKVAEATKQAKRRLGALATVASYGNSFGGLGIRNQEVLEKGAEGINLNNDMRKGSMAALQIEQNVSPRQYSLSPTAGLVGGIANTLAGAAGQAYGYNAGVNRAPAVASMAGYSPIG
jgi:hypothetical protein